jgi:hypothetical protein
VRLGPRGSQVSDVQVKWAPGNGELEGFVVKPNV